MRERKKNCGKFNKLFISFSLSLNYGTQTLQSDHTIEPNEMKGKWKEKDL